MDNKYISELLEKRKRLRNFIKFLYQYEKLNENLEDKVKKAKTDLNFIQKEIDKFYKKKFSENDFNATIGNTVLSAALLSEYGFKQIKIEDSPFKDYKMPYWCKDAVILLYNEGEGNENSFYIGYGENRFGKYNVVPFRWIHHENELLEIYKAVRGVELSKG